jgi:hypothetical protein
MKRANIAFAKIVDSRKGQDGNGLKGLNFGNLKAS